MSLSDLSFLFIRWCVRDSTCKVCVADHSERQRGARGQRKGAKQELKRSFSEAKQKLSFFKKGPEVAHAHIVGTMHTSELHL